VASTLNEKLTKNYFCLASHNNTSGNKKATWRRAANVRMMPAISDIEYGQLAARMKHGRNDRDVWKMRATCLWVIAHLHYQPLFAVN
jgi:hypothetical protein